MATNNGRGIPSISSALMRPSNLTPPSEEPSPEASAELEENDAPAEQGRGAEPRAATAATRPRRRRPPATSAAEKTGKRGLYLSDGVWERLQLEAIRKKTTISAICEDVLSRNLARLRIERDA